MGFLLPFLAGTVVGGMATWQVDRRTLSPRSDRGWFGKRSTVSQATLPKSGSEAETALVSPVVDTVATPADDQAVTAESVSNAVAEPVSPVADTAATPADDQAVTTESVSDAVAEPVSPVADTAAASAADKLEDVRGIGPVYANRLRAAGIVTFADLAGLSSERLLELLAPESSAESHLIHASDWIEQARRILDERG